MAGNAYQLQQKNSDHKTSMMMRKFMLRNTTLAVLTVLALAAASQAAVIITSESVPTDSLPGFTTFTLTATSDVPGQNILAMDWAGDPDNNDPATGFGFFGSMNQVNPLGAATVFEDNNLFITGTGGKVAQDSQFKVNSQQVTVPAGFAQEGPNILQAIWAWPTSPGASVAFAQLAIPDAATGTVSYRGVVSVDVDGTATGANVAGSVGGPSGGVAPVGIDTDLGNITNAIVNHQFATSAGDPPITWSNLTLTSSTAPTIGPTLNANGQFQWHTIGSPRPQVYSWNATATNQFGSDLVSLRLNLIVPEPATMTMFGLALVGLVGFGFRKRS